MVMDEYYGDYESPQRLGKSGITQPCTYAMAAVLTSAYKPEKVIAVIGSFDEISSKRVLFLVWDWFYPGITIIPDGFGTHGGEGGAGLSTVLGLLKFYQTPLLQTWVYEKKAFRELADGTLTEEMFDQVQTATPYDWNFYPAAEVRKVRNGTSYMLEVKERDGRPGAMNIQLP